MASAKTYLIAAPYMPINCAYRDAAWSFCKGFWESLDIPISTANGKNISQARNIAAEATRFDAVLMVDTDTLVHPDDALEALQKCLHHPSGVVIAGDMRMRMDKKSTLRTLDTGVLAFPRPEGDQHPKDGVLPDVCYGEPSSGVIAISRETWEATGGYCEGLDGWGWEDLIFLEQVYLATGKYPTWQRDSMMLHLWHPRAPQNADTYRNAHIYRQLRYLTNRHQNAQARKLLDGIQRTVV